MISIDTLVDIVNRRRRVRVKERAQILHTDD